MLSRLILVVELQKPHSLIAMIISSFQWAYTIMWCPSSIRLSVCPSVRLQTFTQIAFWVNSGKPRDAAMLISLSATLRENGWTDVHEIFREGVDWPWDDLITFCVNSGKPRDAEMLISLSPTLRENGWTDLHEIFSEGVEWPWDDLVTFWVNSGKPRNAATLISLSVTLQENGWTDLHEIFSEGVDSPRDDLIIFWVNSGIPRDAAMLISLSATVRENCWTDLHEIFTFIRTLWHHWWRHHVIIFDATLALNISETKLQIAGWFQWTAYRKVAIDYRFIDNQKTASKTTISPASADKICDGRFRGGRAASSLARKVGPFETLE